MSGDKVDEGLDIAFVGAAVGTRSGRGLHGDIGVGLLSLFVKIPHRHAHNELVDKTELVEMNAALQIKERQFAKTAAFVDVGNE